MSIKSSASIFFGVTRKFDKKSGIFLKTFHPTTKNEDLRVLILNSRNVTMVKHECDVKDIFFGVLLSTFTFIPFWDIPGTFPLVLQID